MMLTASYVLLTLGGTREQVRSGMTYVVISLLASTLFVTALALLYSATGTVNMAELAGQIRELPDGLQSAVRRAARRGVRHQGGAVPAVLLAPRQLPDRARHPSPPCSPGSSPRSAIYAIIRTQTLFFPPDARPATLLLVLAAATMVIGVLGAIAQDDVQRILSFTSSARSGTW